jgi:ribosomal protein S12 methylthiotransferase accessory factor YcaO
LKNSQIRYKLKHAGTSSQTGYFTIVPQEQIDFVKGLSLLKTRPFDSFLHKYLLDSLSDMDEESIHSVYRTAKDNADWCTLSLFAEHVISQKGPSGRTAYFDDEEIKKIKKASPLVHIRNALQPNQRLHRQWTRIFRDNIIAHEPLPAVEEIQLPMICAEECGYQPPDGPALSDLAPGYQEQTEPVKPVPSETTAEHALSGLKKAGIKLGHEMRHQSSLSPFGLLRKWEFGVTSSCGRNLYTLSGGQTSYGKGLTMEDARASLTMEIVERCSVFADISANEIPGYRIPYPLFHAPYSDLSTDTFHAVRPGKLALEVSYEDEPLYWIKGHTPGETDAEEAMVPAQSVFLFSNLDEPDLFSGLGSTGIASGNTMEQAKIAALLEIFERHQEAVVPFREKDCFKLVTGNENIGDLLRAYKSYGIDLVFQDLTPKTGIPCCKCFVTDPDGNIQKGTAAALNARKAILSAVMETPHPFPEDRPTRPDAADRIMVDFDHLPNYSTGAFGRDLEMLEELLRSNNLRPYYVDLTRDDIGIPVVKAVIEGMEILGDFDEFSRVHPELFSNFLEFTGTR